MDNWINRICVNNFATNLLHASDSMEPIDGKFVQMFFQHTRKHCKEFKSTAHFRWIGEHVVATFNRFNIFSTFGAIHKYFQSCVTAHLLQKISLFDRTECDKFVTLLGNQFNVFEVDVGRQISAAWLDQWIVESVFSKRLRNSKWIISIPSRKAKL